MFSIFFINRPIFASVISVLLVLFGAVAFFVLPVAQFPEITPPVVRVEANYPGATAQVVANTVAAPIEQEVNGVENMLYMSSSSDGNYYLDVTFNLGVDVDIATVLLQNRVSTAIPKLPEEVRRQGVTTKKQSTNMLAIVTVYSPNRTYDDLFLTNFVQINLKDEILRVDGVGSADVFPDALYGMRIWLDPEALKSRTLTTGDVLGALREQNVQVAAGQIGQPPAPQTVARQYNVTTLGQLESVEQFENIIVKTSSTGGVTRVKDIARVELGAKQYSNGGRYNGAGSAIVLINAAPGGNAVRSVHEIEDTLARLKPLFPDDVGYAIDWDAATFVEASMEQVEHTLLEAFVLVLIVVFMFLHNWRATMIPMIAIPVSIVGTFAFMLMFGFSVNTLTMFGLILAIGIVVDDAILVVENAERIMHEQHLPPKQATTAAMGEIFVPIIAISLVLMAVFLPSAMLPGVVGQLYRQFALTIAVSTFLSAICALTLSPALCGTFLKPMHGPKGWFGRNFDAMFDRMANGYKRFVHLTIRYLALSSLAVVGLLVATYYAITVVPTGFLPQEDEGMILFDFQLPDNASFGRTLDVLEKVEPLVLEIPGVKSIVTTPGYSIVSGRGLNRGFGIATLQPWEERTTAETSLDGLVATIRDKLDTIQEARFSVFVRPAIPGLGQRAGFDMRLLDRANMGPVVLGQVTDAITGAANAQSRLQAVYSTYQAGVPQLYLEIDREKAKKLGVPLAELFGTLEAYLGSAYVNDFNLFGRTWQVRTQAESRFRASPADIQKLEVRTGAGNTVPLGTLLTVQESFGPERVERYNLFTSSSIQGEPAPGVSSTEALDLMEQVADENMPPGMGFAWTGMSFQEKAAGGTAAIAFTLAVLVVYLILAAQYEAWAVPFAVVLVVPVFILGAMLTLLLAGMDNGIFSQVGLVLLVGLGAKNAILIVEFAREYRAKGLAIAEAAAEASRVRLRPILMTSFAFTAGVLPLVFSSGAGAGGRQAVGVAVAGGMIGGTIIGLFVTPVLYALFQSFSERFFGTRPAAPAETVPTKAEAAAAD